MKREPGRGFFITFEGTEGCGKTTHAALLADFLRQRGHEVLLTREPGGTPLGDRIRALLLDFASADMRPRTEALLFAAARAQHVAERLRPHLEQGGLVICDRFYDATLAYQGYGRGLDLAELRRITLFATGGLTPDLTIFLDVPLEEGLARRRGRDRNRLDALELDFHRRMRRGYEELMRAEPERWASVQNQARIEDTQAAIRRLALARL